MIAEPNNDKQKPRRNIIYYYVIALLILILLNALLFPSMLQRQVTEVGYNVFLEMVDGGRVKEIAYEETESQIVFIATDENGTEQIYKTGIFPDLDLQDRIEAAPNEITYANEIPTQNSPLLSFFLTWILPLIIIYGGSVLLYRWMIKKMGGGMGNMPAMSFGKSGAKLYAETETGVTFADVAGQDEAKDALKEIVDFLHNPGKYAEIGAKLPKGALLVGPPGTGKTLLARAVAGEAHVPFFSISGSEFVEMFVGMGAAKVRDLFKQAGEKAPCIVFIDEIDTIGKKRDSGAYGGNDEREQTLNQLLAEMDGFDAAKGVVILAATNRPESLDPALLRPGRFDRRIPVELPDLAGREAILKVHAKEVRMSDDVDLKAIARATSGASGAELANIINEAALRAVKMGRQIVAQEDLEESVETVIAGAQRKNAVLSDKDKRTVAYHETGHALVAAMQTNSAPVTKITIVPRTSGALGYTMQVDEGDRVLMSREEIENKIATLTGGRAAEEVVIGYITTGASNDIEQATKLARAYFTRYGMSDKFDMVALETQSNKYLGGDASLACSEKTSGEIDEAVIDLVKAQHKKAVEILKANEPALHRIAKYLLEKETITGDEFMQILRQGD
ncbi:MAG TPA: ATP-dependent zinc metalloprotease FtsH [Candidatus Scatomorpha gallistercoris]|nr:ATP-dependent zinc metalloprotease FtsH [Candidatus Scatomorpha gallistercoris]